MKILGEFYYSLKRRCIVFGIDLKLGIILRRCCNLFYNNEFIQSLSHGFFLLRINDFPKYVIMCVIDILTHQLL